MSITTDLLNMAGFNNLPPSVLQALEREVEARLLKVYGAQLKKLEPVLYRQGQEVGRKIAQGVIGALYVDETRLKTPGAPTAPGLVELLVMPALKPFVAGIKSTALPTVTRVAVGIAVALVAGGALGGHLLTRRAAFQTPRTVE